MFFFLYRITRALHASYATKRQLTLRISELLFYSSSLKRRNENIRFEAIGAVSGGFTKPQIVKFKLEGKKNLASETFNKATILIKHQNVSLEISYSTSNVSLFQVLYIYNLYKHLYVHLICILYTSTIEILVYLF